MRKKKLFCLLAVLLLLLCGCGDSLPQLPAAAAPQPGATSEVKSKPLVHYQAPAFADSVFHEELAEGNENVRLDLSAVSEGYVAVSAVSPCRLKFQVKKDGITYNYDLSSEGEPSFFPLQCGDGHYIFRVMENVADGKYAELYAAECEVALLDEFQPFLRPNDYVSYDRRSASVKKAEELAQESETALDMVGAVYDFVCATVSYDLNKAATVRSGYLSDPDATLSSGKGICFDYAALTAAMLRSQGIPTKMVFGYVSPDNAYHAWNMFYTRETGWVTVKFEVRAGTWNRLDLTFSAGGGDNAFIGNGQNYADLYTY